MKDLDKFAYDVVCNWPEAIAFNPVFKGIDYSLIVRFYLWDKVGRAIRIENKISKDEEELYKLENKPDAFYHSTFLSNGNYKNPFFKRKKNVFIPFPCLHTLPIVYGLNAHKKINIISKRTLDTIKEENVVRNVVYELENDWSLELSNAVLNGIVNNGIKLVKEDVSLLRDQIFGTVKITQLALAELKKYKPDALYVHTDNHPPFINYILAAKLLGIPTFMYQHGLDCEHYFLNDCFADYIGVWSKKRKIDYEINSVFKPKIIKVVGNHYLKPVNKINKAKDQKINLLFITRPHQSVKCYSPSRSPQEGINILNVILKVLETNKEMNLVIKPHPMDNYEKYKEIIHLRKLENRVKISFDDLNQLFSKTNIVLTEDSTAGVEAIRYNLPCIHVHFAKSKPTLPFIEYGAAFEGRNENELLESLNKLLNADEESIESMSSNQIRMYKDYIPEGNAGDLVKFIIENI